MEMNKFSVEMKCYIILSDLIGSYNFWVMAQEIPLRSPDPFLVGRRARAGRGDQPAPVCA